MGRNFKGLKSFPNRNKNLILTNKLKIMKRFILMLIAIGAFVLQLVIDNNAAIYMLWIFVIVTGVWGIVEELKE